MLTEDVTEEQRKPSGYTTNPFESGTILLLIGVILVTFLAGLSPYTVIVAWFILVTSLVLSVRLQIKTWHVVPKGRFFLGLQSIVTATLVIIFASHTFAVISLIMFGMPQYYQF